MHIFVGSTNPVKINAVTLAIAETYPTVLVTGVDVPTGVSEQPRTDEETRKGAQNRALAALEDGLARHASDEALGVGLEGGVFENDAGEMWCTVWACVADTSGALYESNGSRFIIPEILARLIRKDGEMGPAIDALMGGSDIRQKQGAIGVITNNFVDRTEEYSFVAKTALGIWYGRDWEKDTVMTSAE